MKATDTQIKCNLLYGWGQMTHSEPDLSVCEIDSKMLRFDILRYNRMRYPTALPVAPVRPVGIAFPKGFETGHHSVFGGELAPVVDKAQIDGNAKVGHVVR